MRIVYVANLRLPTDKAYGIQIVKMCEAFAAAGPAVELLHPYRRNPITQGIFEFYGVKPNFTITQVPAPDFYWLGRLDPLAVWLKNSFSIRRLCQAAASRPADLYFTRDERIAVKLLGWTLAGRIVFEAHKFSPRRRNVYRRLSQKGVRLVAISRALQEAFAASGWPASQTLVAHDGVDLQEFAGLADDGGNLDLPSGRPLAVYCGQFFEWKGVNTIAEAAARLPAVNFALVGGRPADINKLRMRFGNLPNLTMLGHQPHRRIPLFLQAADILLLPNMLTGVPESAHTSPLKLFEYMASARPIVASDLPPLREILNHNNAKLVSAGDPAALANGIRAVLDSPDQGRGLAQQAAAAVQQYSWLARARRILAFTGFF